MTQWTDFHPEDHLTSPEAISGYLEESFQVAFEENDPEIILQSLRTIAQSEGYAELARKSNISRQTLHRALSREGNPTLRSMFHILSGLGFRLKPEVV